MCGNGHEYQATVAHRTRIGSGCPYCVNFKTLSGFNDLATKRPDIAQQWHEELNGDLTPSDVTPGSHKKVWWKCSVGHSWQAVVYSRTTKRAHGCPVCAGKTM